MTTSEPQNCVPKPDLPGSQPIERGSIMANDCRIAFFFWSLELGGVEHMMTNLSREFIERGYDVTLILARDPQPNEYLPDPRVRLVRLGIQNTGRLILALAGHLRRKRYDVLYTAMPTTNVATLLARLLSFSGTTVVISERSNPVMEARHSKTWRYRASFYLQPYIYPLADAIVAVCSDLADSLSSYAGIKRERISVIYNPAFDPRVLSGGLAKTHPWLDDKTQPVIITAGRLMPQKDYATLIRAFSLLRQRKEARLLILGEGPQRAELQALIDELHLRDCVELAGFRTSVDAWLAKADVFALTSLWEGFGNVLVQALGARLSIVSTNCPNGPGEILAGGKFGRLVPVGDAAALAEALAATLEAPFDPEAQYQRALDFTVERSADAYEKLFLSLQAGRR